MGRRIRCWQPNLVYEGTQGCIDRQFLLTPNHRPDNRLLHKNCHPDALGPRNDYLPTPSTINIIGSSIARALQTHPVRLHWFETTINHIHLGFSLDPEHLDNASRFLQQLNSLIARQINPLYEREGHFFSSPLRATPCLDDQAAEQKLFYALTNPVKDNLFEKVSQTPFFSTYAHLTQGKPLRFWYIDWERYYAAGGPGNKRHRVKEYLKWIEIELSPLPGWKVLSEHQRRTRVRQQTREIERQCEQERRSEGKTVPDAQRWWRTRPTDRPRTPRESGRQPVCHASDFETRMAFKTSWREFLKSYREASICYRQGNYEQPFPEGSFRPPLITIYSATGL